MVEVQVEDQGTGTHAALSSPCLACWMARPYLIKAGQLLFESCLLGSDPCTLMRTHTHTRTHAITCGLINFFLPRLSEAVYVWLVRGASTEHSDVHAPVHRMHIFWSMFWPKQSSL
uniref:Uncharacterized protein n=1 Tax=Eutreptiella gymnastica TaxID=73025 RepID=A0A7S1NMK4_9EUGL